MTKSITKRPASKPAVTLREPTAAEVKAGTAAVASQAARAARPSVDLKISGGVGGLSNPYSDGKGWWAMVQEAFATTSTEFANDSIAKLTTVLQRCEGSSLGPALNAALALIGGIGPEDEAQAAIAVQIAVAHAASVHMTSRALANASAGHVEAGASFAGMATKFSRTMVAHVEALTKLRGGGRQIIEHRYINVTAETAVVGDHAQTIVGGRPQVEHGNENRSHAKLDHVCASFAPMPCPEPGRDALPVPGCERA